MNNVVPEAALNQHIAILGKTGSGKKKRLPMPPLKKCEQCCWEFQPRPKYPKQRFCCHKCQWEARGGAAYNAQVSKASAAKRGAVQRGRGNGKSYTKLNGQHAHRVIAEQKLGRPLQPGEIVHHEDEVKQNYSPENLIILPSQSEHARLHFSGRKQSVELASRRITMAAGKAVT